MAVSSLLKNETVKAFSDQHNIAVWTRDLAERIKLIADKNESFPPGIYHIGAKSKERPSRYDLVREIAKILGLKNAKIEKISSDEIFKVPRPKNAVLSHSKLLPTFSWKESLKKYLLQ
jgi:dTDP-4-dehydrorhamnose reductase